MRLVQTSLALLTLCESAMKDGADYRSRTGDLLITNQLLCHLS